MRVLLAYLTLVLMWSTTPIAIKWSGEGPGFLFGVTARMLIGMVCVLLLITVTRQPFPRHRQALLNYLAVFLYLCPSMLALYWASQFIPSGWLAVICGLNPMITALMSAVWLNERSLKLHKFLAYGMGLGGLVMMFGTALNHSESAVFGIVGVLVAAVLQSASSVWVKRINSGLPALAQVGGGLLFSAPVYLLVWAALDGCPPAAMPVASVASIAYLGFFATPLGFALYFYILKHLAATQVSLISLLTPVMALVVGHLTNHEPLTARLMAGTLLILSAVFVHEL
ncbi:MAG: DMT family transporter [Proteobacteria bacterium]|nr:DMT family transporter [Pseudomonadota bacterium]